MEVKVWLAPQERARPSVPHVELARAERPETSKESFSPRVVTFDRAES